MSKHPIFLDLRNRTVVVIGGGAVAERKIEALLEADASITVISPDITPRIREWWQAGRLAVQERRYERGDLGETRLVYVATGDPAVNEAIRAEADATAAWLNVADEPQWCDFFAPAVVRRGPLTIAISTDGASPAFAARLRERLEQEIDIDVERVLEELRQLRDRCRREGVKLSDPAVRDQIDRLLDSLPFLEP